MTKFACGRSARLRFRRAAAMLVVCFGPAVHAISQTAPAQPLTSERSTVNLDVYYRYPIAVGAEYQGLTSFDPFVSGFAVRDVAAEVRVPIPVMPTIQPFLRAGSLSFVQSGTVGTSKWDHTDYYGAIGTSWTHRFAKNFEIGLDLSGGIGQSMFPNLSAGGPVGSLDLLASAGARIVLVPLYNVAVDIRPSLRYQRTIGPLTEFDGFSFGVGFSVGYRFGEDPDAPASVIRSLRFSSAKLPGVFAAMQSYYSTNPIGYVTMTNTESFSITDLEVSFFQPGYMDAPTPVTSIPELAKGAETKIGILAAYGQEVFRTEGITPLAGELIVKYRSHGRPAEQRLAVSYDLYDRTAITWDDDRKVGAFITPADSALRNYVSFVRQADKNQTLPEFNSELQTAAQVYGALGRLGIIYQSDPSSPFTQVQGNPLLVDSVSVARDTLKRGSGDCDDLTVLFTSLLETTGVQTAFITVPGHIFAAFNTTVAAREYASLHPDRNLGIVVDGQIWVPVEITLIGREGFLGAWRKGAELWRSYDNDVSKRKFIRTADAQKVFRPVALRETDLGLQYGSAQDLAVGFRSELASLSDSVVAQLPGTAKPNGTKGDLNSLGVALARFGRYKEAESALARALHMDPAYLSAQINLGNVEYLLKDFRKAVDAYATAEKTLGSRPNSPTRTMQIILLSLSRAYSALQIPEQARVAIERARDLDPAGARELGFVAQGDALASGTARAGEQSERLFFMDGEQ